MIKMSKHREFLGYFNKGSTKTQFLYTKYNNFFTEPTSFAQFLVGLCLENLFNIHWNKPHFVFYIYLTFKELILLQWYSNWEVTIQQCSALKNLKKLLL